MNDHGNWETMENIPLSNEDHTHETLNPANRGTASVGENAAEEFNEPSPYVRFQRELRHGVCQFCREVQAKIYRSVTIRGLPRLFILRRLFCLYWIIVVSLFIFLKLYFPLYLTSTVSRNILEEFRADWCRVRNSRINWQALLSPCESATNWQQYTKGWSVKNSTDPDMSYVSLMAIKEAGDFSRFSIQSQTPDGRPKQIGGDTWRIHIHGPASFSPTIIDHGNGTYEVLFLVKDPGEYRVNVFLEYTLCEGLKDPPDKWFVAGNIHGAAQRQGILGNHRHFLNQPLWQGAPLTFHVPPARGPLRNDEFLSYGFGSPVSCGDSCNSWILDGYGRWTNGTWIPYISDNLLSAPVQRNRVGVLWIYGDSNALRLLDAIKHRPLCTSIFKHCRATYNWVYNVKNATFEKKWQDYRDFDIERVINELTSVMHKPELNNSKSVIVLNYGLHFISAITFESYKKLINRTIQVYHGMKSGGNKLGRFLGDLVWKSTTSMNREKIPDPHYIGRRFMTRQRVMLFNAYASWAMCRAGIKILDVFPISASFPGGTGFSRNALDSVHYKHCVFDSIITALENYYGNGVYFDQFEYGCYSRGDDSLVHRQN